MADKKYDYQNDADRLVDRADAEARSRRAESEANIMRGRTSRARDPRALADELRAKVEEGRKAQEELDRIEGSTVKPDLSGMTRGLTDSEGNFAENADVLTTGGIGVEASNTDVSTGKPAQTAEQAGVVMPPQPALQPEVGKVQGNQRVEGKVADQAGNAAKSQASTKDAKTTGKGK